MKTEKQIRILTTAFVRRAKQDQRKSVLGGLLGLSWVLDEDHGLVAMRRGIDLLNKGSIEPNSLSSSAGRLVSLKSEDEIQCCIERLSSGHHSVGDYCLVASLTWVLDRYSPPRIAPAVEMLDLLYEQTLAAIQSHSVPN